MACNYGQKPDLSLIKVFIAILLIACMTLVSPMVKSRFADTMKDITLGQLETNFKEIQHPEGTKQIALQKEAGPLTGDDKKCDFFIGEVRSFEGTQDSIRTFYSNQKVKDFGDVRVLILENGAIPEAEKANLPGNLNTLSQWNLPPNQTALLYIVYIFSADYSASGDLNCR